MPARMEEGDGESRVSAVLRGPRADVRESGIVPAPDRQSSDFLAVEELDRRAQLALADSARIDGNLSSLVRGLERLSAGAYAAREANLSLARELDAALDALQRARIEQEALRDKVQDLQQELDSVRAAAQRERQAFIQQEDAFLYELIEEHEQQLKAFRARLQQSWVGGECLGDTLTREEERPTLVPPPSSQGESPKRMAIGSLKLRSVRIPLPRE